MKIAIKTPWCYICPDKNPGQRENFNPIKLLFGSRHAARGRVYLTCAKTWFLSIKQRKK